MHHSIEDILEFFCSKKIPILPCHGIVDGICTCKKGKSCTSPGKHPLLFRWQLSASTSKEVILSWIGKGHKSKPINLALRTGTRNEITGKYLIAVDFDLVNHPLKLRLDKESKTLTQKSGSGGDHAFYWSKFPVSNSVQLVDDKVDIRGSGGIVVIAPSLHESGNFYQFSCNVLKTEIKDLPPFIEKKLRLALTNKRREVVTQPVLMKPSSSSSENVTLWFKRSVASIKKAMDAGAVIPCGVRNSTMHRLLSSERAKGATARELWKTAVSYLSCFEDPGSIKNEITDIIKSVMLYPCYNNSHEKVNQLYLGWLHKNGYKPTQTLEVLQSLDNEFFGLIKPSFDSSDIISLKDISALRERFLNSKGLTKFATYKSQLLAKKLETLGIQRKRTSKRNGWCLKIDKNLVALGEQASNTEQEMSKINMAEELKEKNLIKDLKDGEVIYYKGRKVKVSLIKTQRKVTVHPREHFYRGETGYDYNKSFRNLLARLDESQRKLLCTDQLIMNQTLTQEFLDTCQVGDVVGIISEKWIVKEPYVKGNHLSVALAYPMKGSPGKFVEAEFADDSAKTAFSIPELDHARELGFLEILWRDEKPFGEPEFQDMTLVFLHDLTESDDEAPSDPKKQKKT